MKLDHKIKNPDERLKFVNDHREELLKDNYIEHIADYLIIPTDRRSRKNSGLLTENRKITINKRETSLEGLSEKFQGGLDAVSNLIANDKNILFAPKDPQSIDSFNIPELKQLQAAIAEVKEAYEKAEGRTRSKLLKQLKELRQDQYIIKEAYIKPMHYVSMTRGFNSIEFDEEIYMDRSSGYPIPASRSRLNLFNPTHVLALLNNYSKLKEAAWGEFMADSYYLMETFDEIADKALADYPKLRDIMIWRIDGNPYVTIQSLLKSKYDVTHTIEHLSKTWNHIIPKKIVDYYSRATLDWWFTYKEKGVYKRCSKCGQVKLAHPYYFSKNNTSRDGFYSQCKDCRNKRR